jgi:hypothetical protein
MSVIKKLGYLVLENKYNLVDKAQKKLNRKMLRTFGFSDLTTKDRSQDKE